MPLRFGFLLLASVALLRANEPAVLPTPFTAKELAQGYRDRTLLARPLPSHQASIDAEEQRDGIHVRRKFASLHDLRVIELDASETPAHAIARLLATGRYAYVEPDLIRHIAVEPNDPSYVDGSMWQLNNTGANNGIVGADIKALAAWDLIHDAPDVVVAVVDTGVNAGHHDISANLWHNPSPLPGINDTIGSNFVGGNGNLVSGNPNDDNGHGTHVSGTIGAVGNNGIATVGVAWKVQLMEVKVLGASGSGSVSDIDAGIKYAVDHHADIINASYGASGTNSYSQAELDAITYARDHGVIFVAAAGNDSADMNISRFYPASFALDNIVTVGASDNRDGLATNFSNYGGAVDLFAPGQDIVSLNYASTTGTISFSGTSMAAPHVCGALALLKAHFPTDTYRQLINRLLRGVAPSVNPNPSTTFVNLCETGGRLDLLGALQSTINRPFNDDFASRPHLSSANLALRASNTGATAEAGESAHAGTAANSSLWWQWTAPTSGTVSVDTTGSSYDTVLAVYTGSSLGTLHLVASNDDAGAALTSRVSFNAVAGTAYQFAVDSKLGDTGVTLVNLGITPANDAFATPQTLSGESTHVTASNAHCSRETGEPLIDGFAGGTSLWYSWTAPRTGHFQIAVTTADFDPLLAVYTGSSLGSLGLVTSADGSAQNGALCSFDAIAGTTYRITVDAKSTATVGQFTLTLMDSLWQAVTGAPVTGTAAVDSSGHIYIGSTDDVLYALAGDGSQLWTYATKGLIDTCSPAIADDGTIYVGSNDGTFYALNPSGSTKWRHTFGTAAPVSNSPALAADGTIYVKAGDGYLYALNPSDGTTKWKHNINAPVTYASPSVGLDGTIYQGGESNSVTVAKLYALNSADGSEKWTFATDGGNDIYSVPAVDTDGNIYFNVLTSGELYSLAPSGTKRWTYKGASVGSSSSPTLSADGTTVYFAGYDSKLHAVDTANGIARWTYTLGAEVRASSPAIDANGVIYIGCYDDRLYAINPDGTLNRTWDTANVIRSCPAISGHTLYFGSNDNKFYAVDIGATSAGGAWPQYRQNIRHTARAAAIPVLTAQPASQTAAAGASVTLTTAVSGAPSATYQWSLDGAAIPGATSSSLALSNLQPANAGIYAVTVTGDTSVTSSPAIVGITVTTKVAGNGSVVGSNIVHPNGNLYDQVLLTGAAAAITADPSHVTRISFIDLTDDIVQVEFAGHGTLSLVLDEATGPAIPVNYDQPTVSYMRGRAHLVIAGADETTNVSVFSVGRFTAFDPTGTFNFLLPISATNDPANNGNPIFTGHPASDYNAIADIADVAISSTNGKFGGVRIANAHCGSDAGFTGIYAPGVEFVGPVYVGNIDASGDATPVLLLGSASDTRITGGDLFQSNDAVVQVSGITQLKFVDGTDSNGSTLPAQNNRAVLDQDGVDVTSQIVVNPAP